MSNQTIPNLPQATSVDGSEQLWAVQYGSDVKVTSAQIGTLALGLNAPIGVPTGGTGQTTIPADQIMIGNDGNPIATVPAGTTGELLIGQTADAPTWLTAGQTGQFLTANSGGQPAWATVVPGAAVNSVSFGTTGLTPDTATQGDIVVDGTLVVANGGTGNVSLTANAVIVGAGTSATTDTGAGDTGEILVATTGAAPSWLGVGTSGQLLQTNGAGAAPTWVDLPGTGVATIDFGTTGLTPATPTGGVVSVAGTLGVGYGGTGLTTLTAANNALYSTSSSALAAGTLPPAAGGTGLTTFTAANNAIYSTSAGALTAGTLPVLAGGTGSTTATGSGSVVLATSPTLTTPIVTAMNGGALAGFRNRIINGGMTIDQRNGGASQTFTKNAALAYCVDRFYAYCTGTGSNATGQQIASTGASTSPATKAYKFTGNTNITGIGFGQRIESVNCYDLAGGSATISVTLSNSLLTSVTWALAYANSADSFGTLASPTVTSISTGVWTISSTPTVYSATVSIPSAAVTGLQLVFSVGAQTSGNWTIGNVQLEPGTKATPFERCPDSVQLALCQRYLPAWRDSGTGNDGFGVATGQSSTSIFAYLNFPVVTRIRPTGIVSSGAGTFQFSPWNTGTPSSLSFQSATSPSLGVVNGTTGGNFGSHQFDGGYFQAQSAGAYLYFTGCEL